MKQLFRLCKSKNVVWKELPNGDHNNSVAEMGYGIAYMLAAWL